MMDYVEKKYKIKQVYNSPFIYVNHNVKKESGQYFETTKIRKMDKNYGTEGVGHNHISGFGHG